MSLRSSRAAVAGSPAAASSAMAAAQRTSSRASALRAPPASAAAMAAASSARADEEPVAVLRGVCGLPPTSLKQAPQTRGKEKPSGDRRAREASAGARGHSRGWPRTT